jgi:hypothetical protein
LENTSGQGKSASIPAEIDRWNWGAFLLNWIWGIGNNTYIALLMFVPFVNMVMLFVLGFKGSAWAWRNKRWESTEQFKHTQRKWAQWGLVLYAAFIALLVGLFFVIMATMKSSDAFQLALTRLQASPAATEVLGSPITTGFPMGNFESSGPRGSANLSFSVKGPKSEGTVFMEAKKDLGLWKIDRMVLEQQGTGRRIDLAE